MLARFAFTVAVCGVALLPVIGARAAGEAPFWRVATLSGNALGCLIGVPEERVRLRSCREHCEPIPWQLDERRPDGELVFTDGVLAALPAEAETGIVDPQDEVLWMLSDAGRRMLPGEGGGDSNCELEIKVHGPGFASWVYADALGSTAPRSPVRYVRYDVADDTVLAAHAALGFRGPTPRYIGLEKADGGERADVFDRLKIRASARFFGVIPIGRNEDDFETPEVSWRAGPIRVIRRQRQRIRLGFGIRSPRFVLDATAYRDFVELPVAFRLNFRPTYFFGSITVRAILDFSNLRAWRFLAQGLTTPVVVGSASPRQVKEANEIHADWFALSGPKLQLVQVFATSPSLDSVQRRLVYREGNLPDVPEDHSGEMPGVGFQLTDWTGVESGHHSFAAFSYALPADYDLDRFRRERGETVAVEATPLAP